jgi:hypothetical protein
VLKNTKCITVYTTENKTGIFRIFSINILLNQTENQGIIKYFREIID